MQFLLLLDSTMEHENPFSRMINAENLLINLHGVRGKLLAWMSYFEREDPDIGTVLHRRVVSKMGQIDSACQSLEGTLTTMFNNNDIESIMNECLTLSNRNYSQTINFIYMMNL